MSLTLAAVVVAAETHTTLPIPPSAIGAITLGIFALLGIITYSYRDVSNRHSRVSGRRGGDGSGHGSTHGG
jgi:hypothetical protein